MTKTTQCGERRCTLEGAEVEFKTYQDGYTIHVTHTTPGDIDNLDESRTRIKTELDEVSELLAKAKERGAAAWDDMKDSVQTALDRLAASYHSALGESKK